MNGLQIGMLAVIVFFLGAAVILGRQFNWKTGALAFTIMLIGSVALLVIFIGDDGCGMTTNCSVEPAP